MERRSGSDDVSQNASASDEPHNGIRSGAGRAAVRCGLRPRSLRVTCSGMHCRPSGLALPEVVTIECASVVNVQVIRRGVRQGIQHLDSLSDVLLACGCCLLGWSSGAFVGPVAAAFDEDVVARVDEAVEDTFGDDRVGEQRIPVGR